jgi:hypothetical protein
VIGNEAASGRHRAIHVIADVIAMLIGFFNLLACKRGLSGPIALW